MGGGKLNQLAFCHYLILAGKSVLQPLNMYAVYIIYSLLIFLCIKFFLVLYHFLEELYQFVCTSDHSKVCIVDFYHNLTPSVPFDKQKLMIWINHDNT